MVLGLLTIASIPTVTGVSLGVSEQRKQNQRVDDERRMAKFHIEAYPRRSGDIPTTDLDGRVGDQATVDGKCVVLRNDKLYLDTPSTSPSPSHTAEAFYISYPEPEHTKHLKRGLGLVTTVSSDPPMLNWIYADKETHELKYGNRSQSVDHVVGPWDWRDEETVVTLEGKTKFVAVEEDEGVWGLYFDRHRDGLVSRGLNGRKRVGIGLRRRVMEQENKGNEDERGNP